MTLYYTVVVRLEKNSSGMRYIRYSFDQTSLKKYKKGREKYKKAQFKVSESK